MVRARVALSHMVDVRIISKKDYDRMKKEKAVTIYFGFEESPFGKCLLGLLGDRICHISFVTGTEWENLEVLRGQWPGADVVDGGGVTGEVGRKVFLGGFGRVVLKGSDFEGRVWKALMKIPRGATVSYSEVARMCGRARAVRATAKAVAKNSVCYLVPCHRVIRKDGSLHKYRWGAEMKKKLIEFERKKV